MPRRMRSRVAHSWLVPLCLAVGLFVPSSASAITSKQCDKQVNDTPDKLLPCIQQADLWNHMKALEAIAKANPSPADGHPSRNSGEPGYKASADYVAAKMEEAGYDVTEQPYTFTYYAYKSPPTMREVSPTEHEYPLGEEWNSGQSTGIANAEVQPVGGIKIPPTETPSSSSGCTPDDFTGFSAGNIALIQRGTCNFGVKVLNAKDAGAVGVIIFNEGNTNPDRTGALSGSLQDADGNSFIPDIPVAFTPFAVGEDLYNQAIQGQHPVVNISIDAIVTPNALDWNVIAESKGGDKNHVLVADAHLDAIYGEGMLDNGSGSVTLLDVAQKMKNVTPKNKLRFIWFGGEELGLLGSRFYVSDLSSTELSHIGYDLDADVTATPNYIIGVLDPAAPDFFSRTVPATFPNRVYKASTIARDQAVEYFDSIGLNHEFLSPNGTDAFSFNEVGIPASGLLTGQDCCKSQEEVDLFGGTTGRYEGLKTPFEGGCVDTPFEWCDNLDNNDPKVMTFMSKAFATMVVQMAFDNNVMSSSDNTVDKSRLSNASTASRRFQNK